MLHLICGKIAAGKSTLSAELATAPDTVSISEDRLLAALYPDEIASVVDYVRCAARLRSAVQGLIIDMLRAGCSVVLDFPANTVASRSWMKMLADTSGVEHCLHYLDVSDEECKRRLRRRNEEGAHAFQTSDAEFDHITSFFVPPSAAEGFNVKRYAAG
ncbi:AAA family ATPase [Duganella sp. FT94W]|uniref:AAA family ATPase n=1 Tax=Duganella lactea TaxID=2692173 RepID=A0ABW9VAS3_9BURK|nr:ATP-binding protein [Duganella lactea]MYM35872.1 AAA family ATPase [Duganella lactea]